LGDPINLALWLDISLGVSVACAKSEVILSSRASIGAPGAGACLGLGISVVLESMTSVWTAYFRFGSQQIGQACKRPAAGLGDVGPRWPGGSIILFFHGCVKPLYISLEDFCIVSFLE